MRVLISVNDLIVIWMVSRWFGWLSGWLFCCCWSAGRGDPERRKFLAYSGTEVGGIVLCDVGKIHRGREAVRSSNFLHWVLRCLHAYTLIPSLCITVQAYITKDTILYINWYIQPLCFHSGIVACEENTEEETERMEPFYRRTRLNTAGLHRITLWETIQSGKNFYFWILFWHTSVKITWTNKKTKCLISTI